VEVALSERVFQRRLPQQEPIQSGIEVVFVEWAEVEALVEAGLASVRVESAGGGEFGSGFEEAGNNEGEREIAFAAGEWVDELIELEFAKGAQDGGDMAVRPRAGDVKGLLEGADGLAFENGLEGADLSGVPIGEVGEGTVLDFALVAEGLAKEDGGRGVTVGDGSDIHVYSIVLFSSYYKFHVEQLHDYTKRPVETNDLRKSTTSLSFIQSVRGTSE
jgi:hypothetical protein